MKNILTILVLFFYSCSPTLRTGYYRVVDVRGNTVNLQNMRGKPIEGDWHVPTDTLKVGQKIFIQKTLKQDSATVW